MTTVANFAVGYQQFLNPQSEVIQDLPAFAKDPKQLISMYRMMVLVRTFDTKAVTLQRTGKLGTFAATTGQEAVSVAIGAVMLKEDVLCPAYREYGAQLQRGVKPTELLAYWGGDERGSNFANNTDDFPISVPIGTQCLHAAGVAAAFRYRKQPRVAVSVCGDGATSQGDFYEALNVAGAWNLPVVFVVSNNQWAISVPRAAQTSCQTLAQKAIAGGFEGIQVDGNDIIAMRYVFENALEKARKGGGPTLIEAVTYRLCDHTTADDANRYRDKAELEKAWLCEPVARLRTYLMNQGVWSDDQENQLIAECAQTIDKAVKEYLQTPPQSPEAMFDYLYKELPEALIEQREIATQFAGDDHHG